MIKVCSLNYCFPFTDAHIGADIAYFDTETGFSVPGFTVVLVNKQLMKDIKVRNDIPDMLDYHQMLKIKSVVNTPFTLCTLVLYENIVYATENRELLVSRIAENKRKCSKALHRMGWKIANHNPEVS